MTYDNNGNKFKLTYYSFSLFYPSQVWSGRNEPYLQIIDRNHPFGDVWVIKGVDWEVVTTTSCSFRGGKIDSSLEITPLFLFLGWFVDDAYIVDNMYSDKHLYYYSHYIYLVNNNYWLCTAVRKINFVS